MPANQVAGKPEIAKNADHEARISQRAYHLWEQAGRPHGQDHLHWGQAAQEIEAEHTVESDSAKKAEKKEPVAKPAKVATTAKAAPTPVAEEDAAPKKRRAKTAVA